MYEQKASSAQEDSLCELILGENRRYRILGLTVETNLVFRTRLLPGAEAPDLRLWVTSGAQHPDWPASREAAFESTFQSEKGAPLFSVHPGPDGHLLRFADVAEYFLTGEAIHGHLLNPKLGHMVEVHLLGTVLSYWLELAGIPILHASAVSVGRRAVAFVGTNRAGKSSLAVAMMQQGYPLLADDVVGLQPHDSSILARPGFPSMRMWPDLAQHANGNGWERLPLVHPGLDKRRVGVGPDGFGRFMDEMQPLTCVYIPRRREGGGEEEAVVIEPVPRAKAVFTLLRESFLPWLTQAGDLGGHRLQIFSTLVERVPVRQLVYQGGFDHLPGVVERVLADLSEH